MATKRDEYFSNISSNVSRNHLSYSSSVINNNTTFNNIKLSNKSPKENPLLSLTGILQALMLGASAGLIAQYLFHYLKLKKKKGNPPFTKPEFKRLVEIIRLQKHITKAEAVKQAKKIDDILKRAMKYLDPKAARRNPLYALMPQPLFFLVFGIVGTVAGIISRYLYEHHVGDKTELKKILRNPKTPELFTLERFKQLTDFDNVDFVTICDRDNFDIKAHGQVAEMLYGILDPILSNPRLSIPIKSKKQLQHVFAAQDELQKAGVTFDVGYDFSNRIRDWELDYSLSGAKIRNPISNVPYDPYEILERFDRETFMKLYVDATKGSYLRKYGIENEEKAQIIEHTIRNLAKKRKSFIKIAALVWKKIPKSPQVFEDGNHRTAYHMAEYVLALFGYSFTFTKDEGTYYSHKNEYMALYKVEKLIKANVTKIYDDFNGLDKANALYNSRLRSAIDSESLLTNARYSSSVINNNNIVNNINNLPLPFILITVPHAYCTPQLEKIHECDITARKTANILFDALSKLGYNVLVLINNRSRMQVDMNRRESRYTVFRKTLSNLMAKQPATVIDLHSYLYCKDKDDFYKFDLMLYDIPGLTDSKLLSGLTKNLKPLKVKTHKHTTTNDIVTEAYLNRIPAVLVECSEKFKGTEEVLALRLAKAIKNYFKPYDPNKK